MHYSQELTLYNTLINSFLIFFYLFKSIDLSLSSKFNLQISDHHMRGSARPHLNYKLIIGCQCRQENP